MATLTGAHAERVQRVRELQSVKGRKEHRRFAFEGPTLLQEALRSHVPIEELYVTEPVLEGNALVRELDERGVPVYVVDDRTLRKISDLETPTGLVAVARQQTSNVDALLKGPLVLALADLNDPGNVGALVRSAQAFGASGVVHGNLGVDPYHPKVVRGAMGSIFRLPHAIASAGDFMAAARAAGFSVLGLAAGAPDLERVEVRTPAVLIVGHERRGLGLWQLPGVRLAGIPMNEGAESLNAAVAGSVALYVVARRCQESLAGPKSQDYPH
ncbi:MAG TPA: RNA methyltransferase [Candidatus Baltobacteraceae bacterium]|nr:RNA methyltransferase [Candidatus Baltobacteraceae bacterium]